MAVAGGAAAKGAQGLIMALNSAKTVKSTKAMLDNTKEMNKAFESGAMDSLNQVFQGMQNTAPVASALNVLFAQIQAETTESTVGLMTSLLALFENETFQKGFNLFITFLNDMLGIMTTVVNIGANVDSSEWDRIWNNIAWAMTGEGSYISKDSGDSAPPLVDRSASGGPQQIY